jgi:hypothetical protein
MLLMWSFERLADTRTGGAVAAGRRQTMQARAITRHVGFRKFTLALVGLGIIAILMAGAVLTQVDIAQDTPTAARSAHVDRNAPSYARFTFLEENTTLPSAKPLPRIGRNVRFEAY